MKKLNLFVNFDTEKFIKDKQLVFLESKSDSKGLKAIVLIADDKTSFLDYPPGTNDFEKITVRVPDSLQKQIQLLHKRDKVQLYDIEKSTVWGDYRENLTIYAKIRKIS